MKQFIADYDDVTVCPLPNFGKRRDVSWPDMLVIHYTAMKTSDAALTWLCFEKSQVSAHYLVRENGQITKMVRECDRAWHTGQSIWKDETDINSRSIGIEIANEGHEGGCPQYLLRPT